MKRLNIGFLFNLYPGGGAETVTKNIADYLKTQGHTISIFAAEFHYDKIGIKERNDFSHIELPDKKSPSPLNTECIIEKIKELSIDFLVIVPYTCFPLEQIKKAAPNTKVLIANHSIPLWEYPFAMEDKRNQKYVNQSFLKKLEWRLFRRIKYTLRLRKHVVDMNKKAYAICDGYIVLCQSYKNDILRIAGIKEHTPNKVYVQYNPSMPVTEVKQKKEKIVLFVGRHSFEKGPDLLIESWCKIEPQFPDWKLLFVGEGADKDKVMNQAKTLGLKNVEFHPFATDIQRYYDKAAILCLTSRTEGWGMVLIEAQNNGVVPIAFNCSNGVKEILTPSRVNGILVSRLNTGKFARELSKLMSDDELRSKIQSNIIKKNENYAIEKVGQAWEDMFETILNKSDSNENN